MMDIAIWLFVVLLVVAILVGGVVGFLISRKIMTKYLKDNPPINEKMVRAMLMQMGRTPSEKQVRQVMASMNQYK
jgi:uncharacterized protein YneF (UPF0154 family)